MNGRLRGFLCGMFLARNACPGAQFGERVFQELVQASNIGRGSVVGGKPEVENYVVALDGPADSEVVADRHVGMEGQHLSAKQKQWILRAGNVGTHQVKRRGGRGGCKRPE